MINKYNRLCCNKVLPLSYDDSLSYYEQLCKFVHTLNEVIDVANSTPDLIRKTIAELLGNLEITDTPTQYEGKNIVMLGDSNAIGVGWKLENGAVRDETNDGVFAVLRELFPLATFTNYAVSGAGFNGGTSIPEQASKIENKPDVIFVWAGGNDITRYLSGSVDMGTINLYDYAESTFINDNTILGRVNYTLAYLRSKYPEAKICYVIRTYKPNATQPIVYQRNIYGNIAQIFKKFKCDILNLNDFSNLTKEVNSQKDYWSDAIHYSAKAFKEIIAPIFYGVMASGLNVNTYIETEYSFVDADAKTVTPDVFKSAFNTKTIDSRGVIGGGTYSLLFGGINPNSSTMYSALRLPMINDNLELYRMNDNVVHVAKILHSSEVETETTIGSLKDGVYFVSSTVSTTITDKPTSMGNGEGFVVWVRSTPSTNYYYYDILTFSGYSYSGVKSASMDTPKWRMSTTTFEAVDETRIADLRDGVYLFTSGVSSGVTDKPSDLNSGAGFLVEVNTVVSTGFKYYRMTTFKGIQYNGTKSASATDITWCATISSNHAFTPSNKIVNLIEGIYTVPASAVGGATGLPSAIDENYPARVTVTRTSDGDLFCDVLSGNGEMWTGVKLASASSITYKKVTQS